MISELKQTLTKLSKIKENYEYLLLNQLKKKCTFNIKKQISNVIA